jgi:MFS family permease
VCLPQTSQQLNPNTFFNYYSAKAFGKLTFPSYNIGIIATLYVNNGWTKALHKPNAAQKGLITAIYYLGTWLSYVFLSGLASDRLGRRYAALAGTLVTCIGGAVQTGASGKTAYASMIIGRIISGFGNAVISTSVPLYQRLVESCPK